MTTDTLRARAESLLNVRSRFGTFYINPAGEVCVGDGYLIADWRVGQQQPGRDLVEVMNGVADLVRDLLAALPSPATVEPVAEAWRIEPLDKPPFVVTMAASAEVRS